MHHLSARSVVTIAETRKVLQHARRARQEIERVKAETRRELQQAMTAAHRLARACDRADVLMGRAVDDMAASE